MSFLKVGVVDLRWAIVASALAAPISRAGTLTFDLGPASIAGNVVSFDLHGSYASSDIPARELVEFQVDVSGSSSALSAGGTDYSAFSLTSLPAGWSIVAGFADPFLTISSAEADTLTGPLTGGPHLLGVIQVDLGHFGLSPTTPYTVRIDGIDTAAGDEVHGLPATFDPHAGVAFLRRSQSTIPGTTAVPVPAAVWAGLVLLGGLAGRRIARR